MIAIIFSVLFGIFGLLLLMLSFFTWVADEGVEDLTHRDAVIVLAGIFGVAFVSLACWLSGVRGDDLHTRMATLDWRRNCRYYWLGAYVFGCFVF